MARVDVTVSALVAVLVAVLALPPASAQSCPSDFVVLNGVCLKLITGTRTTWSQARDRCREIGADLAVLPEVDHLVHLTGWIHTEGLEAHGIWVGAEERPTGWHWLDGQKISLESHMWMRGEPYYREGDGKVMLARLNQFTRHYLTGVSPSDTADSYVCSP